jgi:hypothetical protein
MGRMAFVPEGQADRSQARSAWESVPQMYRPVGHGMIGPANSRGMSHGNVSCVESVRTLTRIIPYPTGRLFGLAPVPGTSCLATIMLSLWDKTRRGFD